jgi:Der1-like family
VFHMFFLVKYCKALEEGSFRSRSSDFLWMLIFGAWTICAPCPASILARVLNRVSLLLTQSRGAQHRWDTAHAGGTLCEHPVPGLLAHIHDGRQCLPCQLLCKMPAAALGCCTLQFSDVLGHTNFMCRTHSMPLLATAFQVYVWGRRHQYVNLSFLGIFNFTAPYLPWVLLGFSIVLGSSPVVDLLGMVVGEVGTASWTRDCKRHACNRHHAGGMHRCSVSPLRSALDAGLQWHYFKRLNAISS